MAVYQISRIQVRRGQSLTGTGLPQLASGEFGWCVDSQELYIGNGSVAEGAPAVGNTRILSLNDLAAEGNVLQLLQYAYRANDPSIQTSVTGLTYRSMQAHLDDIVSIAAFGAVGDGATDDTVAIQLAVDQLFLNANTYSYNNSASAATTRVTLYIPPGIFKITSTIYVPSYASIVGAGIDKSIFLFEPTTTGIDTPAFRFVNDTSASGEPNEPLGVGNSSSFQYTNQPRYITFKDFTVDVTTGDNPGLQLDAVRSCVFDSIKIKGNTTNFTTYNAGNVGIIMQAKSSVVTCQDNLFSNIRISGVTTAIYAQQDIVNNSFDNCSIYDAQRGFVLGEGSTGGNVPGQQYGPMQTNISNTKFDTIKKQAVYLERGEYNLIHGCKLTNVGNDGAGNLAATYPQIYIKTMNNSVDNIQSDRGDDLVTINSVPYIPEVTGNVTHTLFGTRQLTIGQINSPIQLFRLPIPTDSFGVPGGAVSFKLDYLFKSTAFAYSRKGTMDIGVDVTSNKFQLTDDYEFVGSDPGHSLAQVLDFSVRILTTTGATYTGAIGQTPGSIAVYYINTRTGDAGLFNYSYTSTSFHI